MRFSFIKNYRILTLALATVGVTSIHAAELDLALAPTTSVGGYGELHLNFTQPDVGDAEPAKLDFHRFVLFFGHSFTEEWSLKAELELEHNIVEVGGSQKDSVFKLNKTGYLPLEQAMITYKPSSWIYASAGVVLTPAGLTNPNHEPPSFLTVERPLYSNRIIPSTWFGNGMLLGGELLAGQVQWQAVAMEGLNTTKISTKEALRGARQKGFESSLASVLTGLRADYSPLPNALLGASLHHDRLMMQSISAPRTYHDLTLLEAHARYTGHGIHATAEFGHISYNAIKETTGLLESSLGWYAELGYNVFYPFGFQASLTPFVHLSKVNPAQEVIGGGAQETANKVSLWKAGIAYHPIPSIVLKADLGMTETGSAGSETTEFNAGVGYQF